MQRRIDLHDEHYTVTAFDGPGDLRLQVEEGVPQPALLTLERECRSIIQLGDLRAEIEMAVKGETAYIRAYDRTFTLGIVDPVDQAALEVGGSSNVAKAPMPGMVVETEVAEGDRLTKGQAMITIESMKILTVIKAPRDGEVARVHFGPGDTFDKNAVLVTLTEKEEE